MSPESAALLRLAESIADGDEIDWEAAETHADLQERAVVRQLRVVGDLARLHRSLSPVPPAPPVTAVTPSPGETGAPLGFWGHLALLDRLGGGTFGEVYHAWDRALERDVALKLLRAGWVEDPKSSRLSQEGRHLARVRHPNVVTVHGVAVQDGRVGLWMELIRGATLEQLLLTRGPFSAHEAALAGVELCRGLAAIHSAGLVHRDVKAQNVMREDGGRIVLMDLGTGSEMTVHQRSELGGLAGTPLYLAPEIFAGASADAASDVYSLGVLLYRLVTRSYPVQGTSIDDLRAAHAAGQRTRLRDARPDLPASFIRIVDRTTAGDPGQRYHTAGALEADLLQFLQEAEHPAAMPAATPAKPRPALSRWTVAQIAAAVVVVLAVGLWMFLRDRSLPGAGPLGIRSIAVLPLVNLSGDSAQDYLADGLTDELISTFGRLPGLSVTSRTSVMGLKGDTRSLPEIARQLNVDAVLEGTVALAPGVPAAAGEKKVRVNARLIHAGTDTQLWNQTIERALGDVLALQHELAQVVARAMRTADAASAAALFRAPQAGRNSEAQDAYLEARSDMVNASRDSLGRARGALERAVSLDPGFARAHASLALCYLWLEQVGALDGATAARLSSESAGRALQLDANLPEAHHALADVELFHDWDWNAAGTEFARALELNASYTMARRDYAWYLAALGRGQEAVQHAREALINDSLNPDARAALAMMLYFNREYDAAIAAMQRAISQAPDRAQQHGGLGRAYAAKQDYPAAIRELEQAIRLSGGAPVYAAELARVHAAAGNPARGRELLAELQARAKRGEVTVPPIVYSSVYLALGDRDEALRLLAAQSKERTPLMLWITVDPRFDAVRSDPRFGEVVRSLGIPQGR